MAEQERADHRQIAQAGDRKARQPLGRRADEARADQRAEPDAEDGQRQPRRHLIGEQRHREHGEDQRQRRAGERAGNDAEAAAAGGDRGRERGHRARQHHALDAEVQHARLLDHQLAERREQERGRGADHRDQDEHARIDVHVARASRRISRATGCRAAPKRMR